MMEGLTHMTTRDAVREGDGNAMVTDWKLIGHQLHNRKHPKYNIIRHNFLAGKYTHQLTCSPSFYDIKFTVDSKVYIVQQWNKISYTTIHRGDSLNHWILVNCYCVNRADFIRPTFINCLWLLPLLPLYCLGVIYCRAVALVTNASSGL